MIRLKLLDKYIFKQVFFAFLVCVILFMIVWIAPETLLRTVQRTLSGQYTVHFAIQVLLMEIPKILGYALPIGIFLGSLFTFDKLSKDFEVTVIRSFGVPFHRIIAPVFFLSIIICLITYHVNDTLIPYVTVIKQRVQHENPSSHFVFPMKDKDNRMSKIIIVSNFDNNEINDVVVLNFYSNENGASLLSSIDISDYARYDNSRWVLDEAKCYKISTEGVFQEALIKNNITVIEGQTGENAYRLMKYSVKEDRELTNKELYKYIALLKAEKMTDEYNFMMNKLIQRVSHSLMCILFAILGCLLGFSQPREQRLIGFTIAVAIIFAYYITMPFLDLLAEKSIMSPFLTSTLAMIITVFAILLVKIKRDL
ncbi:LptF/LptG family permease [bacterium]|nr:LptF/LptG family permease [bacterium]